MCEVNTYSAAGLRSSEDSRTYGSMETNTETDQTADTDASESNLSANRRRRSRRRRTDNEATLMDGESDNASVSENGIGKDSTPSHHIQDSVVRLRALLAGNDSNAEFETPALQTGAKRVGRR